MPRFTVSPNLDFGLQEFPDLLDVIVLFVDLTDAIVTDTRVTTVFDDFFDANTLLTFGGRDLEVRNGAIVDGTLKFVEVEQIVGDLSLRLDRIEFELGDILDAYRADGDNPRAVEDFFGSLDWQFFGNESDDFLGRSLRSFDDVPIRLRGDDLIDVGGGNNIVFGAAGNDTIRAGSGQDQLAGGNGSDLIKAGGGADLLLGNAGRDKLLGQGGNDALFGQGGNDEMRGARGNDALSGGGGYDTVFGNGGNDTLDGGTYADVLFGGAGADLLLGKSGADDVDGGGGRDVLRGGAGSDVVIGGNGNDKVFGGGGDDFFIFENDRGQNFDKVMDFEVGGDQLQLIVDDPLAVTTRDGAKGAVFKLGNDVIRLEGVSFDDLTFELTGYGVIYL